MGMSRPLGSTGRLSDSIMPIMRLSGRPDRHQPARAGRPEPGSFLWEDPGKSGDTQSRPTFNRRKLAGP